ncbi:mucin-12 isoform X2 [Trichoplusia ni]|uniref:Mucin-12 isoform X2 n=1 Tax=Trichoplusia ni TaxID=7111 RepID=A0A7E5W9N1_TRINI|nr:mucin-12 isoform X2 [Trichoplusia ni]
MSGKPASVGASRAGVPGTPRVVVYVADPRQLEPGAAGPDPPPAPSPAVPAAAASGPPPLDTLYIPENLHHQVNLSRSALYRTQIDRNDQRNLPATIFYKHLNDDNKVGVYGSPDNINQRADYYPVQQQYIKDTCIKGEDRIERPSSASVKQDCNEQVATEYNSVENFHNRIPVESVDVSTYQARCSGPIGSDNTMNSMHPATLRHGQNQYSENVTVQSGVEGSNCSERELSVCKSFVNYQFLEQSVSHQSIVNQSISILNQQVGVNRGIVSEGDSGSAPQLVRTADGVVLAVLPAPILSHPPDNPEQGSRTVVQSEPSQTVTVPLGWKRIISGTSVLYVSPSGTALSNLPQLRDYLQTAGTCKCGLPCPLRPETAFSFDSKVASKPYQAASGAELTKLCNHKRKLLTTLQARAQSPATPPPQNIEQKKATGTEVSVLKKKMKKRPGFPANVSVSQLMVQRERPLNEFKTQETESNRESSTAMGPHRGAAGQPCLPSYPSVQQNVINNMSQDSEIKQETHVQRSSHYLTVNSGWISQHSQHMESLEAGQKQNPTMNSINNTPSPGLPVLGTNGQIIGVNTGISKHQSYKNNSSAASQVISEQEQKDDKKDLSAMQQNMHSTKYHNKEEEAQMFCGLNQALTPEVMQKINEQQQIFIQQNQKQIEMAMKGYRTQFSDNVTQNKSQNHGQYVPQGQLVIQNGTVVKTNPAKTPPWQVKRSEPSVPNSMTSPSPKLLKSDNELEEPNTSVSEDSSSSSYSSFSSNEQVNNQVMCSRVPPLPQHYNMMGQQWPGVETNKKKAKGGNKGAKKKNNAENKVLTYGNNGLRMMQDSKASNDEVPINNVPSFMDDPSGYLAQQTVLLNNTISKQVGINSTYDANQYENSNASNCCVPQNHIDKLKSMTKPVEMPNVYRNNASNPSLSPTSTPDSSVLSDKSMDNTLSQCCKGCNVSVKSNSPEYNDNQMRMKYMKHHMYKMELDSNSTMSSPKHGFDDNPVTSSTFIDRSPMMHDNCGPIQAATVSTSNVSITETLQPPEQSPTLSNSSRNTDTPHSNGNNSSQIQSNCNYPIPSPAYSNSGPCRDNYNSNTPTPGSNQMYPYNSPGPPNHTQSMTGTQVMHFISNHNVNKNLMEVDNISMLGVKPGLKPSQDMCRLEPRRRIENSMPGYCPPPHLGGGPAHTLIQACYVQTFVTTMASGFSVTRDTVTSVLAGKANTATTSINASQANFIRPPPPPSVNLATTYAIPNNQPDPFIHSVNLPTSYPLHIAGTTAQNMISKSPLEMVQNVIGSLPLKPETSTHTSSSQLNRRACSTTPGQILISSTGQIMVSSNHMPPPPPKTSTAVASLQGNVTNVTTSMTQVVPAVGGMQPLVNQPTVVVNTLPAPFVIQPPMMAVDGQVMQQNIPQIVAGGIVSGQSPNDGTRQIDMKSQQGFVQGMAMLSPESLKKRSKKKKNTSNITNVLQITAPQQNTNNIMVHHTSPQHNSSPQFSPRGFQLSPNNNISPTPMLQALTIVPGKSGTPAHIVMNGQGNTNNFGSQQIITNTSPSQQINLLQPVNLINNASSVVPNFPAFQQFIVPNLGGMMMTADGTALIPDNSTGMPVQLQLQTVNGQNVLTPVQNPGVFAASTNGGVVLRTQNQQSKIIQSQHSPGAQFISPNSQVMMNSPNFNGQLSPLLANLSPTNVTFNTNPQVRSGNVQTQEFIQTNQMGQALMVPLSPKQVSLSSAASNRSNSTFVQQNTTIVQQQTTLVSNSHNSQMSSITTNLQGGNTSRLSIDPNILLGGKQISNQKGRSMGSSPPGLRQADSGGEAVAAGAAGAAGYASLLAEWGARSSVCASTQTLAGKSPAAGSPPDTTTHSPLGALEPAASPRAHPPADTTTAEPDHSDNCSSAMVQCVSSSEPDIAESREHSWPRARNDFNSDTDSQSMISNTALMRQNRSHNPVESTDMHFNQNMNSSTINNQPVMPMTSNYYERSQTYKRKNDFGDASTYRPDKIMRTPSYNMVHGMPKDSDYEAMGMSSPDKTQSRHFPHSGTSSDTTPLPKVYDRHNMGSGDGVEN